MFLVLIVLAALFFSGVRLRIFILPAIAAVLAVVFFAVSSSNRMARVMSFLNAGTLECYYDDCYQALHGVWGLAAGRIFGLGLRSGEHTAELQSLMRRQYTGLVL